MAFHEFFQKVQNRSIIDLLIIDWCIDYWLLIFEKNIDLLATLRESWSCKAIYRNFPDKLKISTHPARLG